MMLAIVVHNDMKHSAQRIPGKRPDASGPQAPGGPRPVAGLRSLLLACALALATAAPAPAGSTDPVLALGSASMEAGGAGALLELNGIWHFDDILQVDFPLTVVAYRDDDYVAVPVNGAAFAGSFAGLSDGLAAGEIAALEASGGAAAASVLRLDTATMSVALPAVFSPGFIDVVVYVELPGEGGFVSNRARALLGGS
jgi:hypothetical protein